MSEASARTAAKSESAERRILHDLGYFGHYLHVHHGGRNGKETILKRLLEHGSTMTQRELLETSCVTSASLSESLAKLETEGLLERTRSESDRRQLTITLTAEGERAARQVICGRERFEAEAFTCLSPEERDDLLAKLDRIYDHWNRLEEKEKEAACQKNKS